MATFTQDEYKLLLSNMVAASTDPVLTPTDIDLLLKLNRVLDESGLAPTDADWESTYDLNRAALEGWKWKMGRVSDLSTARTGDLTLEDANIVNNIEKMIDQYRRAVHGAVWIETVAGASASDTEIDEDA
jgi:hypothetical protein